MAQQAQIAEAVIQERNALTALIARVDRPGVIMLDASLHADGGRCKDGSCPCWKDPDMKEPTALFVLNLAGECEYY